MPGIAEYLTIKKDKERQAAAKVEDRKARRRVTDRRWYERNKDRIAGVKQQQRDRWRFGPKGIAYEKKRAEKSRAKRYNNTPTTSNWYED